MLFVGCSFCRSIGPLVCAGQFMPHMPVPVEPSAWGPACGYCGPMPPVFTCSRCFTQQWLLLQGAAPPQGMQQGQAFAPVVQAPAGAGESQVMKLIKVFVGEAGKGFGQQVGNQTMNWLQ